VLDQWAGENMVGKEVTPADLPEQLLAPLAFGDILEVMTEDGVDKGTALGILSLFGAGLQQHDSPEKIARIRHYMDAMPRGLTKEQRRTIREQLEAK